MLFRPSDKLARHFLTLSVISRSLPDLSRSKNQGANSSGKPFDENLNSRGNKEKGPAMAPGDNGKTGKRLTILSIDGGGVRGIIPARILEVLESYLQALDGKQRHLWEYFDLIAGTSSGGLITAMITTPTARAPRVPLCNATQVVQFFEQDAVRIFPKKFTNNFRLRWLLEGFASVFGPIYSAQPLEDLLLRTFGDAHLSDALTSVIIPAFDTDKGVPVFFSNLQSVTPTKPLYNVLARDACRATTAVPIFFPAARVGEQVLPHQGQRAVPKVFNVIDGGVAVNDPTLVAVTQAIAQERKAIEGDRANTEEATVKDRSRDCTDFRDVLVLSLGTGQHPMRFIPRPYWSSVQWLLDSSGSPLLNSFLSASQDMVEYYTSMIFFDGGQTSHNYLRIQTDSLSTSEFWGIDDATNLDNLKRTANNAVDSGYVSERDFATGNLRTSAESIRAALRGFARLLVEERRKVESTPSVQLPENFGRTRRRIPCDGEREPAGVVTVPSTAGAVQTTVDGCCLMMRAAVGACCLKFRAAKLFFVCCLFCFFCFLQVIHVWLLSKLKLS